MLYSRSSLSSFLLLSWVLCILAFTSVQAIRCVNCKGCAKFEESQTVTCQSTHDRCLKLHMPSGMINRECGDEKMCQHKKVDGRHTAVHCCDTNVCNEASGPSSVHFLFVSLMAISFRYFLSY